MKNIIIALLGLTVLSMASCKKDGIVNGDVAEYEVGSYLSYTGAKPGQQPFDLATIETSTASINVKVVGTPAKQVNIYTGTSTDKSTWTLIKSVPFQDSGTLSVTGGEVAAALGVEPDSFTPGTSFTFYNEIVTVDGRLFSAANTSSDFQAQSSYNMAFTWSAVVFCAYDESVFDGNFEVVVDEWQDYSPGDIIVNAVEPGPGANQLTMHVYPNPAYGAVIGPIIIDVDPATNVATVQKQPYGDYYGSGYGTFYAEGSGSVNSCEGTIDLDLTHTVAAGSFGTYHLTIKKT